MFLQTHGADAEHERREELEGLATSVAVPKKQVMVFKHSICQRCKSLASMYLLSCFCFSCMPLFASNTESCP